jgi:hypothetical protein
VEHAKGWARSLAVNRQIGRQARAMWRSHASDAWKT